MVKFELNLRKRNNPKEDLITDIQRVANEVGRNTITSAVYAEKGKYGVNTMLRRFGSWNNALKAAGLALNNRLNVPNEELFENLANIWQALGRQPVGKDISKTLMSDFSLGTYEKRFGSWNNALVSFIRYVENPDSNIEMKEDKLKVSKTGQGARTPRKINWRLRAMVLIRDNCICRMCGASPSKDPTVTLHVDHIKPWSKGGETVAENLQTLCAVCNIGKSDVAFD